MNSHVVEYCATVKRRRDDLRIVTPLHNNTEISACENKQVQNRTHGTWSSVYTNTGCLQERNETGLGDWGKSEISHMTSVEYANVLHN